MKSDYIVRAKKFLDVFSRYLPDKQYITNSEMREAIYSYKQDFPHRRVNSECGSSRVVFFTSDYAIKVDTSAENWWGTCTDEIAVYD